MKKFFFIKILLICIAIGSFVTARAVSFAVSAEQEATDTTEAVLFVSNSCGCCINLKQEQFSKRFRERYEGKLLLKEYEVHTPEGDRLSRKYNIDATPNLFIGKTKVEASCYTEEMFRAIDRVLPKYQKKRPAAKQTAQEPYVMSITTEEEELTGIASKKDLSQMQKYLERVKDDNAQTLGSIVAMFNNKVVAQAMALIDTNEKKLKNLANKSSSFQAFKKGAAQIETTQQKQLDQLLRTALKSKRK